MFQFTKNAANFFIALHYPLNQSEVNSPDDTIMHHVGPSDISTVRITVWHLYEPRLKKLLKIIFLENLRKFFSTCFGTHLSFESQKRFILSVSNFTILLQLIFYTTLIIVWHAALQEYIFDKCVRRLNLSKTRTSKFSEHGQLFGKFRFLFKIFLRDF